MMKKTRCLALFGIVLMGCSDGANSENEESMRSVEIGDTSYDVPANPERVVTDYYAGELLAVDAEVVGATTTAFDNPFLEDQLASTENIGEPIDVERVLELDPDLIVVMYDDDLEQLREIAPTVYIPYNTATSIEGVTELFGSLMNNEEAAAEFLEGYEQEAREARAELEDHLNGDETFGLYEVTNQQELYVFGENFGRGGQVIYDALELPAPQSIAQDVMEEEDVLQLSREAIPEYAADVMFITSYDPEGSHQSLDFFVDSSVWQGLDAVENDRVVINDFDTFYPYDPISIRGQIPLFTE